MKLKKKREYEERVHNIEHGTFTPLVFSAAGGMGPIATTFYRHLAALLSDKLCTLVLQSGDSLASLPHEFLFAYIDQ